LEFAPPCGAFAQVTDDQLREHNRAFEDSMGFGMASVLLRGLAVENLLKGILIQRDPEKWGTEASHGRQRLYRWTHDIERLAKLAQVELDEEDARVSRQLTLYIEWAAAIRRPWHLRTMDQRSKLEESR